MSRPARVGLLAYGPQGEPDGVSLCHQYRLASYVVEVAVQERDRGVGSSPVHRACEDARLLGGTVRPRASFWRLHG